MKIALLSLILGLLIFSCGYEAAMKRNWKESYEESEEGEIIESSRSGGKAARLAEFRFEFFRDQSFENMYTDSFRSKASQILLKCDKAKIDELMDRNYDVFSSGIWDELIKRHSHAGIKYLLNNYFTENQTRRQAFRDSIIHGATSLAKFILANFKSALRNKNAGLVQLACRKKRYKILKMMASEGNFDVNCPISYDEAKTVLHNAVIGKDLKLVKVLLKFKNIEVNCVDALVNTPLHYANDLEIMKLLMKNGANVLQKNCVDMDPVNVAVKLKKYDLVQAMIPDLLLRFDHFHTSYKKSNARKYRGTLTINRQRVLEDSYYLISREKKWNNMKYYYMIEFEGESGIDQGGLTREWMSLLIERFFVPRLPDEPAVSSYSDRDNSADNGDGESSTEIDEDEINITQYMPDGDVPTGYDLKVPTEGIEKYFYSPFECVDADNKLYRISTSFTGPAEVYKVIGSILGKSLLWKNPLKVKLVPSIVKLLLGRTLTFEDLEEDDLVMYRSMLHCLEPDFDFGSAFYTMPSDDNIIVDAENVERFLNETAVNVMYTRYKAQLDHLVEGFRATILHETLGAYFSPAELQSIFSGADKIDRADLYRNIQIKGAVWMTRTQMFWSAMDLLQDGELIELVRFVTGTNGLPFGGVSSLGKRLSIFDETRYSVPKASTCNYHLALPTSVQSAEELVEVFRLAISSDPEFMDRCRCCR